MHSSTFSSDRQAFSFRWAGPVLAVLVTLTFIGLMEWALAARGFQTTVLDTAERWLHMRDQARRVGDRGVHFLGSSRIQLAVDLNLIRDRTNLRPVQLAIDGTSPLPVFAHLARDPGVKGTVIVDYYDDVTGYPMRWGPANQLLAAYDRRQAEGVLNGARVERFLEEGIRASLRSYADGARPLTSLVKRILDPQAVPQYLVTLHDRSRAADHTKVRMPDFYYRRVVLTLDETMQIAPGIYVGALNQLIRRRIDALRPADNRAFLEATERLRAQAAVMRKRGVRVVFVRMPSSGLVKEIEDHRYPRRLFWDRFAERIGTETLHFEDVSSLAGFRCPDGSHLDQRHRAAFTRALIAELKLH